MRKIAFITGSRADLSPLLPVIMAMEKHKDVEVQIVQTTGLYGHEAYFLAEYERLNPDLIVVLGDRYETLVAASVACLLCKPICHLHGGETTEGAVDDNFRHAISKLAYYHFPSNQRYAARLQAMGESPDRIFTCGAPGVDALVEPRMSRKEIEVELEIEFIEPVVLVCLHPETLGDDRFEETVAHLATYKTVVISGSNADIGGDKINQQWMRWLTTQYRGTGIFKSTYSQTLWRSLMWEADALVGNSSGFVIEGLTLQQLRGGKPEVIIIGDRQKGRYDDALEMFGAYPVLHKVQGWYDKDKVFPFGVPGEVAAKIAEKLMTLPIPEKPRKVFYDA